MFLMRAAAIFGKGVSDMIKWKAGLLCLFAAVLLLTALTGCGGGKDTAFEQVPDPSIHIQIQENSLSRTGVILTYENTSDSEQYEYGDDFGLEKKDGNNWKPVDTVGDLASTATLFILPPGETTTEEIKWERKYGILPSGEYRLVKHFEKGTYVYDEIQNAEIQKVLSEYVLYVSFSL